MPQPKRVETEDIVKAYQATGSVWKAGKQVGIGGQSVHERLVAIGYPIGGRRWDDEEIVELKDLISNKVPLGQIANRLARTYAGVACKASELGVRSDQTSEPKLPRGKGYTKPNTLKHMKALESSPLSVTQYARSVGLDVEPLVRCLQKHCLTRWNAYVEQHSSIPKKDCPYCGREFIPNSGKQVYCSRKCGNESRVDASYFGGKRRTTVGLTEKVCQLCGRENIKGLSSHHVLGKENDPENDFLIALCPGCHQVVTLLGGRSFIDDPRAWESLISLVWTRAHGPDIADGVMEGKEIYTEVTLEVWDEEEELGEAA